MARLTDIPDELKIEIIRLLPDADKKTLSLSCRVFREATIPEIYRSVTISTNSQSSMTNAFLAVSNFGSFVKEVTINIQPIECAPCPLCDQEILLDKGKLDEYFDDLPQQFDDDGIFAKDDNRWDSSLTQVRALVSGSAGEAYKPQKLTIHVPAVHELGEETCEEARVGSIDRTLDRYDEVLDFAAQNHNITHLTIRDMPPIIPATFRSQAWISLLGRLTHLEISLLGDYPCGPLYTAREFYDFVNGLTEVIFNHLSGMKSVRIDVEEHNVKDDTDYLRFVELAEQWQL